VERRGYGYSLVSRDTEALDLSDLVEVVGDRALVGAERQVANEEGVAGRADDITVLLGAVGSTSIGRGVGARLGREVKAQVAALEEGTGLLIVGLLSSLSTVEVDVAEATRAAGLLVADDASADNALDALELLVQGVVINTPAEVTNPKGSALLGILAIGLGLLGRGISGLGLLLGLPLLRGLLGNGGLLLGGLLIGVGIVRARVAGLLLILVIILRLE
jgi:hypothetical protein